MQTSANKVVRVVRWLFASDLAGSDLEQRPGRLAPRWIFLRALGLIFFSAFYSLLYQARGLIGPDGLLPARVYLQAVTAAAGLKGLWYAPTLLWWLGTSDRVLLALCWVGMVAAVLLTINVWPRLMCAVCTVTFLSFVGALQTFASYQSDGMLLGAGFLSMFFAPPGLRPGWGERNPPSRVSLFLLQWLWFTIYFESGIVKIRSGDPQWWPTFTAMDEYYQNGPLPTWIAWYAQHLPHWFHAGSAVLTLVLELGLVWALFLPRRFRIVLFWIVTPWQIGIILTSNYAFLNYLVLALGVLLLDDEYLARMLQGRLRGGAVASAAAPAAAPTGAIGGARAGARRAMSAAGPWVSAFCLTWIFYATAAQLLWLVFPSAPLPQAPVEALETVRIAEQYGLFAVMTRGRYEIEFQGSNDGTNWVAYPFRNKPQDPRRAPRVYAPYQPRFDWNLWFASLGNWQDSRFVTSTEAHLLENSPDVLSLFAGNPFPGAAPKQIRAVLWRYWFSDWAEKRQGLWWRRTMLGLYAPTLARGDDGKFVILGMPLASTRPTE